MPRITADLICAAARRGRPLVVALEFATKNQPMIDAYIASDGGDRALAALLSAPLWDREWADGKSSRAMLKLIEWLRFEHMVGRISRVVTFDVNSAKNGADRERQMADRLLSMNLPRKGLIVVLTGRFHAGKGRMETNGVFYAPLGALMPPDQTVSLRIVSNGGTSWNCQDNGCGVHQIEELANRARMIRPGRTADGAYDGLMYLGAPATASPPVK